MSKKTETKPSGQKPSEASTPIWFEVVKIVLPFISGIIAAYLGYLAIIRPQELAIEATRIAQGKQPSTATYAVTQTANITATVDGALSIEAVPLIDHDIARRFWRDF